MQKLPQVELELQLRIQNIYQFFWRLEQVLISEQF